MAQDVNKENAMQRLTALYAKVSSKASTESEVESAARMMARILSKNEISEAELMKEVDKDGVRHNIITGKTEFSGVQWPAVLSGLWQDIEQYCGVKVFRNLREKGVVEFCAVGEELEVQMALYLATMLANSAKRGWLRYSAPLMGSGRKDLNNKRLGFERGFVTGLRDRIATLVRERDAARETYSDMSDENTASMALVVTGKQEALALEVEKLGIVYRKTSKVTVQVDLTAFIGGLAHSESVSINRPVKDNRNA